MMKTLSLFLGARCSKVINSSITSSGVKWDYFVDYFVLSYWFRDLSFLSQQHAAAAAAAAAVEYKQTHDLYVVPLLMLLNPYHHYYLFVFFQT